jgi:hypothetical protein
VLKETSDKKNYEKSLENTHENTISTSFCHYSHPMVLQVFKSLATNRSKLGDAAVKVTAYDFIQPVEQGLYKPSSTTCDVMVFPTGMRYSNLHSTALNELVRRIVSHTHNNGTDAIETAKLGDASVEEDISKKLVLLVCCHAARDARCGARGPPVARALMRSVHGRSLQSLVEVYATSHVGGHAYAANVLVYGARFPSDGDWFGGVHEDNAEEFLDALLGVEIGVDGGAGDKRLRQWWRGRLGLTKEQQLELWEAEGGIEEVPDGGSEEEDDSLKSGDESPNG